MIKLKKLIKENEQPERYSTEAKKNFLEIVSTYNKYQEMMDRKSDITQVAETLGAITEAASQLAISEGDDWFDKHTVKRNMGELKKLGGQFDKIAKESALMDQRLTGLYEDMGHIISRYYKIGEITEDEMKSRLGMTESKVNEYDEWRNTRIQAKNIFRMLKLKYKGDIAGMKTGLSDIFKQNRTKPDQEKVMWDEFNKYFKIKESKITEAYLQGAKYSKDGYLKGAKGATGKHSKEIAVDGKVYRWNSAYKTYNSVKGNELLHKSDIDNAKSVNPS